MELTGADGELIERFVAALDHQTVEVTMLWPIADAVALQPGRWPYPDRFWTHETEASMPDWLMPLSEWLDALRTRCRDLVAGGVSERFLVEMLIEWLRRSASWASALPPDSSREREAAALHQIADDPVRRAAHQAENAVEDERQLSDRDYQELLHARADRATVPSDHVRQQRALIAAVAEAYADLLSPEVLRDWDNRRRQNRRAS